MNGGSAKERTGVSARERDVRSAMEKERRKSKGMGAMGI